MFSAIPAPASGTLVLFPTPSEPLPRALGTGPGTITEGSPWRQTFLGVRFPWTIPTTWRRFLPLSVPGNPGSNRFDRRSTPCFMNRTARRTPSRSVRRWRSRRDHPRRSVGRGDLLVIPREYALDLGPQVDLLAIRHEGPPPDHFRERFIQVWGFEHFPAPPTTGAPAYHDVVPASEVRFRVLYAILDVSHGDTHELEASEALRLCVMLDGQVAVACSGVKFDSSSRQAFLLPAGAGCRLRGTGRLGVLILHHELSHDARRQAASRLGSSPLSPERAPSMTSGSPFAEIE